MSAEPAPRVPIRDVRVQGPTFHRFERAAEDQGTTVAVLVSHLADTVGPLTVGRRRYVRMTPELWIEAEQMLAAGTPITRVATQLGVHRDTIRRHLKEQR